MGAAGDRRTAPLPLLLFLSVSCPPQGTIHYCTFACRVLLHASRRHVPFALPVGSPRLSLFPSSPIALPRAWHRMDQHGSFVRCCRGGTCAGICSPTSFFGSDVV